MTNTTGLRINMNVSVTYVRKNGTIGGYDGRIDEIATNDSILVVLFPEPAAVKPEYRRFKIDQIKHLLILD